MAYTTAAAVAGIIDVEDNHDLSPFIATANELVVEVCVPAGYSDARLEIIEMWLAAHFYAILNKVPASETVGPVQESYQYRIGLNLANTMWGQQALVLDTNGGLAALSKAMETGKRQPKGWWLGTELT